MKIAKKQVRIIKKIREASGVWRFISLQRAGSRYVWDDRPGYYFLDWREGQKRKREYAGDTPSEATEGASMSDSGSPVLRRQIEQSWVMRRCI
jgi:hypothetical protein